MSRETPVPTLVRMNPTRTSFKARASAESLSNFSYAHGTSSMNADNSMPAMEMNRAKPDRPAVA